MTNGERPRHPPACALQQHDSGYQCGGQAGSAHRRADRRRG